MMHRIAVLTSGGDAPGMNAAICAVVRSAQARGWECVGVRRGYSGLISGDMYILRPVDVSGIMGRGGTMLYTARSDEFLTEQGREKACNNCRYMGIDAVIAIGGNGTIAGANELSKLGMPVMCIPATIDNDVWCSSYTIGFDTACNTAIESIDRLSDTMQSHERCSIVEVMGRDSGQLAMNAAIACGATVVLIPEIRADIERDIIDRVRCARLMGRTHFTVIVAEGAAITPAEVGRIITAETGVETRITILGHVQRGGRPLSRDRTTAAIMGCCTIEALSEGSVNRIVCMQGDTVSDIDVGSGLACVRQYPEDFLTLSQAVSGI